MFSLVTAKEFRQALADLLRLGREILQQTHALRRDMADQTSSERLQFSDVKAAVTQLVNDNTASNNAIAAQLKEVQGVLVDLAAKSNSGETIPQADYQTVISQLAGIHASVMANTASVQASTASIQQAEAGSGSGSEPSPTPVQDPGTTGSGSPTSSSSSSTGLGE